LPLPKNIVEFVLLVAVAPFVYYLLSLVCAINFFRAGHKTTHSQQDFIPPVSIIKPVSGLDSEAYENFASFCRLEYPDYELLFAVADPDDSVIDVIQRLQQDFPERPIRLMTSIPKVGANRKVNNLCLLTHEAVNNVLVMSDSDVRVVPDYLRRVVAPLCDPEVGAATCLFRAVGNGTFGSKLEAMGMAMDSAPGALIARKLEGGMQFAFGWTIATTKQRLAEIGGWEAIANHHSDDFELGHRLARAGYRVELLAEPVGMVFPEKTLTDFVQHEIRWSIGLRNVRPIGYWGVLFTHGLPWSLLAGLLVVVNGWPLTLAAGYLASYLGLRVVLTYITGVWGLRDRLVLKNLWVVPFRDVISFAVWIAAFFMDEVKWRGFTYRVEHGLLVQVSNQRDASR
jgi:ceramide glucosyltransferase